MPAARSGGTERKVRNMGNLHEKSVKAAARYLAMRGYDVIETEWSGGGRTIDIVAREDDCIVFADVSVSESVSRGFAELSSRKSRELAAAAYFAERSAEPETRFRFDSISLLVVSEDRAIVKHHVNCLDL